MLSGADSATGGATCATFITSRPDCPGRANGQAPRSCSPCRCRPTASTPGIARHAIPLTTPPLASRRIGYALLRRTKSGAARGRRRNGYGRPGGPARAARRARRNRYALLRMWSFRAPSGTQKRVRLDFSSNSIRPMAALVCPRIPPTYPQNRAGPTTQKRVRRMLQRNSHLKA